MFKVGISIFSLIVIQLSLSSCGFKFGSDDSDSFNRTFEDAEEAAFVYRNSTILCDVEAQNCPSYVAALVAFTELTEYKNGDYSTSFVVSYCSGTLIDGQRILTNRHCLPDDLQYAGADCRDRFKIIFPRVIGYGAEKLDCDSVESLTSDAAYTNDGDSVTHEDWAIIRIKDQTSRPFANVSLSGMPHDLKLQSFPVFYETQDMRMSNGQRLQVPTGRLRRRDCTVNLSLIHI